MKLLNSSFFSQKDEAGPLYCIPKVRKRLVSVLKNYYYLLYKWLIQYIIKEIFLHLKKKVKERSKEIMAIYLPKQC